MNKLLRSVIIVVLMLSGCGFDGTPTRQNDFTSLTSIEIGAVSQSIAASHTVASLTSTELTAIGDFSGEFTRNIADQAVWSSDTPSVAAFVTPSSPSRVTGIAPGTANLTATVGSVSATFRLTVSSATISTVTITPAAPTVSKGLTAQFSASGSFSDSTSQDLTFDATWASSDPAVATVSNDPGNKGLVQALADGTSTISATFPANGISGTTLLTVTVPVLQSITVTPANPSILSLLSIGNFQAIGHFSDGTNPDITTQAVWSSSRPDIATIAASGGAAKTFLQGTSAITATLNGVSGTTNLKVTGGNLTGLTISPATVNQIKDTIVRMTATGSFSNGSSRDITGSVTWAVANLASASVTITPGGNLAFLNALAVTPPGIPIAVTATSGTLTATTNLTVTAPVLQSLAINQTNLNLIAGTSTRITATGTFSDNTTHDLTSNVTWSSGADTIAKVGDSGIAKGRVTGTAAGATTIKATFLRPDGATITAPSVTVTVTAPILQSLTITPATPTAVSGNQVKVTATAIYIGQSKDVTEDATWTIDNTNIAILADSANLPGQVVGVDSGSATLTATFGGKTQTTTVTVP